MSRPGTRNEHRPVIGVFDSGVGGLTVLRELVARIHGADYLYFGDTARLPYGSKSAVTIAKYAVSAVRFLELCGADMIVIACNTACALAYAELERATTLPMLGVIRPGAEAATHASKTKRVLVIATEGTVGSHAYQSALRELGVESVERACPLFVPLVEEGWFDHIVTEQVARIYLEDHLGVQNGGADTLLLGCTHYPLLKPLLRRIIPENMTIVDSAESTAQTVAAQLPDAVKSDAPAKLRFFATDSIEKFCRAGTKYLQRKIDHVELIVMDQ